MSRKVLGASLIIAGTAIGAGMLALPVLTCLGGFLPALVVYIICWGFMACTGLLLAEVCLWAGEGTNLVTMASKTLGLPGKIACWLIYLFLFYSLTIAYTVGGGSLVADFFDIEALRGLCSVFFVLALAPFVWMGPRAVEGINRWLVILMLVAFVASIALGSKHVDSSHLQNKDWGLALIAMPIIFVAFAYQGVVPTIVSYLERDPRSIRKAIIIGSLIPLIIYVVWEWLILGVVPLHGPGGLAETMQAGQTAIHPLKALVGVPWLYNVGQVFGFSAIVTSFLGVTLGLRDFLADGLGVEKTGIKKLGLVALVFVPPMIIAARNPQLFTTALNYAGGFGCALLLGLMPVLMVWRARYRLGMTSTLQLRGGRLLLLILMAIVVSEIALELAQEMGWTYLNPFHESLG